MKISNTQWEEDIKKKEGWHILTVAEDGFSMLDIYGRHQYDVDSKILRQFADRVNNSNESGSLFPLAPISAVPSKFFRDDLNSNNESMLQEFKKNISDFLTVNLQTIKASNLIIDFHVSPNSVPQRYIDATIEVLNESPQNVILDKVLIVN